MERDEKREEAEKLYGEKCLSCATIAEQLGVAESTVYCWKAAAMAKHMSVLKKLDTRGQYKRGALDMIKTANQWLAENRPELKAKLDSCWDSIVETLIKSIGEKETG